jgi:hypothetical protein
MFTSLKWLSLVLSARRALRLLELGLLINLGVSGFNPKGSNVGFMADKVPLGHVLLSENFGFPLPIIMTLMLHAHLSSEASTIGPFCGGNSLPRDSAPPHTKDKNNTIVPSQGFDLKTKGIPEIRSSTNELSGTKIWIH